MIKKSKIDSCIFGKGREYLTATGRNDSRRKLSIINYQLSIILFLLSIIAGGCQKMETIESDKLVLLPVKNDPTVSFRIWFKVGSQDDPRGKEGLALLTASMLTNAATKTNSYEAILEKLYPMAASYDSKVDKEMTTIIGRVHKDNVDGYYKLFTDAILKPAFKESDFKRIKSELINYLEKELRYSSDEELCKAALYNFIFEGTAYGHLTAGTVESLNRITLDDVRNFYKKHFTRNNYVIGVGGGYEEPLLNKLNIDLTTLPIGDTAQAQKPVPPKIEGLNALLIDKKCDATAISFGFPIDVLRGDDDFFALALFNSWFGEHRNSSSHLYQVIREKRGMNYGDYSYIEAFLNGGQLDMPIPNNPRRQQIFEVWLRPVQNDHRHFAIRAAMRELKKVVDSGMTQEQFDITKKFLDKYALHYAQTTMMRLGYQIDSRFYGIKDNGNYVELFRKKINALTLGQVNNAIKKHIQYENIKFAIVTADAKKFAEELIADIPSHITYPTPKPPEILAEDKEIESFPLKFDSTKVRIVSVDDMFAR